VAPIAGVDRIGTSRPATRTGDRRPDRDERDILDSGSD
jgi:hypothetical protein